MYVVGNQPALQVEKRAIGGKDVLLVALPTFASSGTAVVVDLETLRSSVMEFNTEAIEGEEAKAMQARKGEEEEIGLVKVIPSPLRPGAGANKRLPKVGDVSILGIVAKKSAIAYPLLHLTRLSAVYTMAEIVANALTSLSVRVESDNFVNKSQNIGNVVNLSNKKRASVIL